VYVLLEHLAGAKKVRPDFKEGEGIFESDRITRAESVACGARTTGEGENFGLVVKLVTGCQPEGAFPRPITPPSDSGVQFLMQPHDLLGVVLDAGMN